MAYSPQGHKRSGEDLETKQQQQQFKILDGGSFMYTYKTYRPWQLNEPDR